jgi:AmmeMemoRadiSam system protein A
MPDTFTPAEQQQLLTLARQAIAAALAKRRAASPAADGVLKEKRGAFVTLHERATDDLRGCVGYVEPLFPLAETIVRAAVAAALHDTRFEPVTTRELPALRVEISVLSVPEPLRPQDVVVGTHGLILSLGGRSGLLLPQVATEHGWDVTTFLEQTCRKAGLPAGAWRRPEAHLLGFSATVFGEAEA